MKILISTLFGVAFVCIGAWWFWPPDLTGDGGFELVEERPSPSGAVVAKVYAYRGGATVSGFTMLLVHAAAEHASPERHEFRVADSVGPSPIEVQWRGDSLLLIQFPSSENRLLLNSRCGVEIQRSPSGGDI